MVLALYEFYKWCSVWLLKIKLSSPKWPWKYNIDAYGEEGLYFGGIFAYISQNKTNKTANTMNTDLPTLRWWLCKVRNETLENDIAVEIWRLISKIKVKEKRPLNIYESGSM